MPERAATPRLYTIPPSAPFLTILARALLNGDLPLPGGERPDPLTLPLTTIYLPTRRAARALREAFLAESGGQALLLPRINALGHADEDAALIFGAEDAEGGDGAPGAPAIDPLPRRLALMKLILAWGRAPAPAATEAEIEAIRWVSTPGQASSLAADLARLMDFVESEEVDFTALDRLVPEDLASHWEATTQFLKIVTEHWPQFLQDNALVSPVTRRNLLMAGETARLAQGPDHPVIAAGSTGTVPATARLLETIARLPNGAVVLPGLDLDLDDESWELALQASRASSDRHGGTFAQARGRAARRPLRSGKQAGWTGTGAAPSRERVLASGRDHGSVARLSCRRRPRPRELRERVDRHQPRGSADRP